MPHELIVILGPTASGKSSLAIKLAKKFNGEIISADSRQVYKGLDIGSGKVGKKEQKLIPHHLLDIVSPKKQYTVANFKHDIKIAIAKIMSKGKLPFLVGGTPFWIYAVIDDLQIPKVPPNLKLRRQLAKKSPAQLFALLKKLDPRRAQTIDRHNPRRLIRAIEIIKTTGRPIPILSSLITHPSTLILGIKKSPPILKQLIVKRVKQRLQQGLVAEVKTLIQSGLSRNRLSQIGLTYKVVTDNLRDKNLAEKITAAEYKFAKRQMTWFKTDPRIHWIANQAAAEKLIKKFVQ